MVWNLRRLALLPCLLLALSGAGPLHAQAREESRVLIATEVLDELRTQRDNVIPERILQRAYGIAVIPDVKKAAFVVGVRHGNGVLVVRDARGRFTSPVFISLTGGSFGWQIGAQATDIVLVFTTRRGVEGLADGKLTLGAGASVAAGPVGRAGEAAAGVNAEVFSYSRSRGLFAGLALDGTSLNIDHKANERFYGRPGVLASDIMTGAVGKETDNVKRLLAAIAASTNETAAMSPTPPPPAAPAPAPAAPVAPPAAAGGAQAFPLEDKSPGASPH
jgi:lipid-binding SYLF domain-containing protein